MKEKKVFRRLLAVLLTAVMLAACAVPSFAATQTYTRKISATINAGSCYHIVNTDISGNKIAQYTYRIVPQTKDTRYDIVFVKNGVAVATAECRNDSGSITSTSYLKTSTSSNSGLVACIYVKSGKIKMSVSYKSANPNKTAKLTFQKQSSSHRPLKSVTVTSGHKVYLQRKRGNVASTPVIFSAKKGVIVKRTLNSKSYETYDFRANSLTFRSITSQKVMAGRSIKYDSLNGKSKYVMLLLPGKYSGVITPIKGTSAAILYPSDCMSITAVVK